MDTTQGIKASDNASAEKHDGNVLSREWQILAGGAWDGLSKTVQTTASDLKQAATDFVHNPTGTTVDYLKNHWTDAAAGAALALLAPEGKLNKLLVAYSLRGVGLDTISAGAMGFDSSISVNDARNFYSNSLAHEGTAFLSSMPLALAGGYVGRIGANTVFGRGNGIADMLPGRANGEWTDPKVSFGDVRNNVNDVRYAVNPKPVKIAFTDNDGTMADFSTFESKGIEKAIPNMATKLNELGHPVTEEELYKSIGGAMDANRSHDYPWVVELALKDRLKVGEPGGMPVSQFTDEVVKPFWDTIDQSRHENLKLLPNVESTLQELNRRGIQTVMVSDAPPDGLARVVESGLNKYLDRIYLLDNTKEPIGLSDDLLAHGRARIQKMLDYGKQVKHFELVPKEWEKPNPSTFKKVLDETGVDPHEAIMIDDSRTKGVTGAWNAGIKATWAPGSPANAIWAEYGLPTPEVEAALTRLRPLPETAPVPNAPKVYTPSIETAKDYSALLNHLEPQRNYRWLTQAFGHSLKTAPAWQSIMSFNVVPSYKDLDPLMKSSAQLVSDSKQK